MAVSKWDVWLESSKSCQDFCRRFLSFILSFACFVFVIYQTHNCIQKYNEGPKSTQVSIVKASEHAYPDFTFCHQNEDHIKKKLENCGLTTYRYKHYEFIGSNKSCADAVGTQSDLIKSIKITNFDDEEKELDILNVNEKWLVIKDSYDKWRCYTFKIPKKMAIKLLSFKFKVNTDIYILGAQTSFDQDWKLKLNVSDDQYITTDILYETYEVLDFDGDLCQNYDQLSRDECLETSIHQVGELR